MTKDWLQNLVDKDKAEKRSARNRPTRRKSLLSETADQEIGRTFYAESTGKAAAQRMATAERQDAAHKERQAAAARKPAEHNPGTPPPSVFGKPKAPSFETKVPPPGRPKPQFVGLEEEPRYPKPNKPGHHYKEEFWGPGSTKNKIVPPPKPTRDVIASPEMDEKVIKHLQRQPFNEMTTRFQNERSWEILSNGEIRRKITNKETPHRSYCSPENIEACIHTHPKDPTGVDQTTGLMEDGSNPDEEHRNIFGHGDWAPVKNGQPNYIIGPKGDVWVLESKGGEYVPRFVAKRFDIFGR